MKRAVFSSVHGGQAHRDNIIAQIETATNTSWQTGKVARIDIMSFAFTDQQIKDALVEFLSFTPKAEVRLLADWNQGSTQSPSVVGELAELGQANLSVRIKRDAPYVRDPKSGQVRWAYAHSHGMLHHKTMCISLGGTAKTLVAGSYNWSNRGAQAYENTIVLDRAADTAQLLEAFTTEFDSLWHDDFATLPYSASADFATQARRIAQAGGNLHDIQTVEDLLGGRADGPDRSDKHLLESDIIAAFSGRHMTSRQAHYGFSPNNSSNKINLLRPSGKRRPAPVTINSVALEAIRSVPAGHPIQIAMYALSPRVPEYAALLEAAARGCPVSILLDGKLGRDMAEHMAALAEDRGLPISVCVTSNRRMHQKYLVAPKDGIVVTGTANMTEDATTRHADHRILFRNEPELSAAFAADFQTIWDRVNVPV